jgi:uncharacterized protein (TIGR02466 family)
MSDLIQSFLHFPSPIYTIEKLEYLDQTRDVCYEHLHEARERDDFNEVYPLYNTGNISDDERLRSLAEFILDSAWNILDNQGYNMSQFVTTLNDFWCQEHLKGSGHERHMHDSIITGFYFLDCPENSCRLNIHDPRSIKEYLSLPEKDKTQGTYASNILNIDAGPGTIVFTNSWLPHSFTRNESNDPFRMIHFNIGIQYVGDKQKDPNAPEII